MDRILNQKLGPEFVSQRPGPGGSGKLSYVEGWRVINIANQVFGYNGWSSNVISITTDFIDCSPDSNRFSVGVSAVVRVTLSDGTFHEDVGFGNLENSKSKAAAIDKCKKEAVTDALKRAFRHFGNVLGNCLYDKAYVQQIVKLRAPQHEFDPFDLYHGPQQLDADVKPPARSIIPNHSTKPEPDLAPACRSVTSALPPHLRTSTSIPGSETTTPLSRITVTGLVTPAKTPDHRPLPQHHNTAHAQFTNHNTKTRVSFADRPTENVDHAVVSVPESPDEFSFASQDDAYLAAMDLSDADLCRPIKPGEAGGGDQTMAITSVGGPPITNVAESKFDARTVSNAPGPGPSTTAHGQCQARQAPSPALQLDLKNKQAPMTSTTILNRNRTLPATGTVSARHSVPNQNQDLKQQDQNQYKRQQSGEGNNNTDLQMKRPSALPMGGFHFPPGMNPLAAHPPLGSSNAATIGVKRPAESPLLTRRPPYGMGLAQQQQQKRESLGAVDNLGDAKRIRRQ